MKNINMNGTKSADPTWNVMSSRNESASAQKKNDAAIKKWDGKRQQRRWAAIDAALSENPKMTHIEDRKAVAKNLWNILDRFERKGHGKKEDGGARERGSVGKEGNSTKQLHYYTLPPSDVASDAPKKQIDQL